MSASPQLCFLTPTWRGDLAHFRLLRRSLRHYGLEDAPHLVIVHTEDREHFAPLASGGMRLLTTAEVLPPSIEQGRVLCMQRNGRDGSARAKFWRSLSKRIGWPRWTRYFGWQVQQLTKLQAPLVCEFDAYVVLDSDLMLCAPLRLEDFVQQGLPVLLEDHFVLAPDSADRHAPIWADTTCRLLGQSYDRAAPGNYRTATPVVLSRAVMQALVKDLEQRHGLPWHELLLRQKPMSWSEFILYNRYAERHQDRLVKRWDGRGFAEVCLYSLEQRQNPEPWVRQAFESPQFRFLRIQSETRERARFTGQEYEAVLRPYLGTDG